MARILGTVISLALIFSPQLAQAAPTKKKTSTSSKVAKKTKNTATAGNRSSKSRSKKRSSQAHYRAYDNISPCAESISRATVAGVPETQPLMRVIPQRDGRFLLEPLKPKNDLKLTGPTSKLDHKQRDCRCVPWKVAPPAAARQVPHALEARPRTAYLLFGGESGP